MSIATVVPSSADAVSFAGFVKNFLTVQRTPSPDAQTLVADNLRARFNILARPRTWARIDVSYNLVPRWQNDAFAALNPMLADVSVSEYRAFDFDAVLAPDPPDTTDNVLILHNLDRAAVTLRAEGFDVIVGRQAVAWGSARSVNPTDVIAPFLFTEIDTEDRIGVDAARVRIPVGMLGEVDAGYVAGKDARWKRSAAYVRGQLPVAGADASVIVMGFREHTMLGIDLARSIGGAGSWLEATQVWLADSSMGSDYARVSTGVDYSLAGGVYLFVEYHYSSAGASDPSEYLALVQTAAFIDGAVYLFGRHYAIPGFSWPATPLLTIAASSLINLEDGSFVLAPTLDLSLGENLYLSAGAFSGFGDEPTAAGARSEFGSYPDTYYAAIRYYY